MNGMLIRQWLSRLIWRLPRATRNDATLHKCLYSAWTDSTRVIWPPAAVATIRGKRGGSGVAEETRRTTGTRELEIVSGSDRPHDVELARRVTAIMQGDPAADCLQSSRPVVLMLLYWTAVASIAWLAFRAYLS